MSLRRADAELVKDALAREGVRHARTVEILQDPEFVEGGRIGLEQETQGLGIPLPEARRRAEEFRQAAGR